MSEDIRQYLQECAASYGIAVSSGQAEQFQWYMEPVSYTHLDVYKRQG